MIKSAIEEAKLISVPESSPPKRISIWQRLIEPSASIHTPERRRRARLLSALLVILFLLDLLAIVLLLLTGYPPNGLYINAGATFILAIAYYLSRTSHYNLSALLAVSTLSGLVFATEAINPDPNLLYFLILGVLVSSLFLSRRDTALIMAATIIGIGLLLWASFPVLPARDAISTMFAVLCVGILGIATITIRQQDTQQIQKQARLLTDDIAKRNQAEEALREYANELATIYRASAPLLNVGADLTAVAEEIAQIMVSEFSLADCGVLLVDKAFKELKRIRRAGTFTLKPLPPLLLLDGLGLTVTAARTGQTVYAADVNTDPRYVPGIAETQSELAVPLRVGAEILGVLDLQSPHKNAFDEHTQRQVAAFAERAGLALKNAQLYETVSAELVERHRVEDVLHQRLAELEAVNQVSTALRVAQTLEEMLPRLLDATLAVIHAPAGSIWLYDKARDELRPAIMRGYGEENRTSPFPPEKPGEGIAGYVFATRQPFIENDLHLSPRLPEAVRQQIPPGMGGITLPIRTADNVLGTFSINVVQPRELTPIEIHLLTTLSEIAGNAIQRISLHQQTEKRLQHLIALSEIDRVISSSFDLHISLDTLLNHVIMQLDVDAADVLLFDSNSLMLECVAEHGFRNKGIRCVKPRLNKSYAGEAILNRHMVKIKNIKEQQSDEFLTMLGEQEAFVSYYAVPLMAKGYTKGVLEIFKRAPLDPDEEWLDFLNTLAGQAAIAIDNTTLFDGLQRSNVELLRAYDATIEGWSHALDLRDKETEGHTLRVTDMTMKLARAFELSDAELAQVRWGALLHDIGKMGIPDMILLKPGSLTDEEWVIMKKHPDLAYELLSPIHYLHSALDIPYCHHEKWDGTGYPRGLKGKQIPLTARIFAIVDVWDALSSDRPYRAAWSKEKVHEHIKSLAGTHFDPQVVDAFLEMNKK